jgi:hypothetical protein
MTRMVNSGTQVAQDPSHREVWCFSVERGNPVLVNLREVGMGGDPITPPPYLPGTDKPQNYTP